jgi:hypothetical protein
MKKFFVPIIMAATVHDSHISNKQVQNNQIEHFILLIKYGIIINVLSSDKWR